MDSLIAEIYSHINTINDEMGNVQIDVAVLRAQVDELLLLNRAIIIALIGFFITQIGRFLIKKNYK